MTGSPTRRGRRARRDDPRQGSGGRGADRRPHDLRTEVTALLTAGQHGTTFGGNPLACAAGLAVLDTIERDHLLEHVRHVGALLDHVDIEGVVSTRGRGLLRAIELDGIPAPVVMAAARDAGFIVNAVTATALRLAPPLVITEEELQGFLDALPAILDAARATGEATP